MIDIPLIFASNLQNPFFFQFSLDNKFFSGIIFYVKLFKTTYIVIHNMSANQKDIAAELGVSQMTVSLALSGRHAKRLKPELVEKICSTARKMGYRYSVSAQNLRTAPKALGLLILQNYEAFRPNIECHDAISTFILQCRRCMRTFQIEWFDQERYQNDLPRLLTDGLVGGIICYGHASERINAEFAKGSLPIVKINEEWHHNISFDMKTDMQRAVRALYNLGHTRIGIFNCSKHQVFTWAKAGFVQAMSDLNLVPACIYETHPDGSFSQDVLFFVDQFIAMAPDKRPTALMVDTALTAKTLISALLSRGVRIPDELGIFTFCSVDWENDYFIPALSGLEYTFAELMDSAIGLLLQLMTPAQLPEQQILISQKISFRDSVLDIRNV